MNDKVNWQYIFWKKGEPTTELELRRGRRTRVEEKMIAVCFLATDSRCYFHLRHPYFAPLLPAVHSLFSSSSSLLTFPLRRLLLRLFLLLLQLLLHLTLLISLAFLCAQPTVNKSQKSYNNSVVN